MAAQSRQYQTREMGDDTDEEVSGDGCGETMEEDSVVEAKSHNL